MKLSILQLQFCNRNFYALTICTKIVVGSIRHLVVENKITVDAFVIMNSHMHFLWHTLHPYKREDVRRDLLKFTAQMIIKDLRNNNAVLLQEFYVGTKDRKYQQLWRKICYRSMSRRPDANDPYWEIA